MAYKIDCEAAKIIAETEALKMNVYKAEVDAYAAQVAAEKYRFDAYESKVKGNWVRHRSMSLRPGRMPQSSRARRHKWMSSA